MKKLKEQPNRFPGFPPDQQTWNFPNIINGFVNQLTGAEFKVLWYILRHTYGWQKEKDRISLTQFENGIFSRKNNRWLDRGTGLTRQTIITALKSLEAMGFIKKTKSKINYYEVVKKLDLSNQENRHPNSQKTTPTISYGSIIKKQTDASNNKRVILTEQYNPDTREEFLTHEIAKNIGVRDMQYLLSVLENHGFWIIEKAHNEYRERNQRVPIRNPQAYMRVIIERLAKEKN